MSANSQLPYQQPQGDLMSLQSHQNSTAALDSMVWGDRSKDDFNMLAQLQKVNVCLPSISTRGSVFLVLLAFRRLPRNPSQIRCDLKLGWQSSVGLQSYFVFPVRGALAALSLPGSRLIRKFLIVGLWSCHASVPNREKLRQ